MKIVGRYFVLCFIVCLTLLFVFPRAGHSNWPDEGETILVGKISYVEGELLRYVPDEQDWVATDDDAPFGIGDIVYSSFDGKAEMIMPNNTWIRIGGDTQIQLIQLNEEATEIDLDSATARLYNKSSRAIMKVTTAFGQVIAPADTIVDIYANQNAVEIIALQGTVFFVHNSADTRHEVIAGSSSILADRRKVTANQGLVASGWDAWNTERDTLWRERMRAGGVSSQYLPSGLDYEAQVLDDYGRWESVYYDGAPYYFWRPLHISVGWAPFTMGRWNRWYGDYAWMPYEPFGYVTHHYGNWLFLNGYWYWAPPVSRVMIHAGLPLFNLGYCWYPGRVAWIHSGVHVGWITLAPHEYYYGHRYWGRRSILLSKTNRIHVNRGAKRYRNHGRSVIINQNNFYGVKNYSKVRIKNVIDTNIVKNYLVTPVIDAKMVKHYKKVKTTAKENFNTASLLRRSSNQKNIAGGKNKQGTKGSSAKGKIGAVQRQVRREPQSGNSGNGTITAGKNKRLHISKGKKTSATSLSNVEKRDQKGKTGYSTERQSLNKIRTESSRKSTLPTISKRQAIQSQYQSRNRTKARANVETKTRSRTEASRPAYQGGTSSQAGKRITARPNARLSQKQSPMVRNQTANKTSGNFRANGSGFNSRRSGLSLGNGFMPRGNPRR